MELLYQFYLLTVLTYHVMFVDTADIKGRGTTFCQNEQFKAKCSSNEVIVMTSALYGRMEEGRCIKENYGYIPCMKDVLEVGDHFCSGRQQCTIGVPNDILDERKTCPSDLISYLEASYVCKKVITRRPSMCQVRYPPQYISLHETQGLLSSTIATETSCGTHKAPWMITAKPGQTINFTLHDFSYLSRTTKNGVSNIAYAVIKEDDSHTIWAKDRRTTHAYLSKTNTAQVYFHVSENKDRHFVIEFEVQGCADPAVPKGGWSRREGNDVIMGCNDTSTIPDTWILKCQNNKWKGKIINCSLPVTMPVNDWNSVVSMFSIDLEMALVLIAAIAFVIASIIILLGIICLKRKNFIKNRRNHLPLSSDLWNIPQQSNNQQYPQDPAKYSGSIRSQENEYASIQDNNYGTTRLSNYTPVNMNDVILNERNQRVEHHVIRDLRHKDGDNARITNERDHIKDRPVSGRNPPSVIIKASQAKNNNDRQYFVNNDGNVSSVHDERAYSY